MSIAVHMAIIGAITATTVHGGVAPREKPQSFLVHFDNPPPPPRPARVTTEDVAAGPITIAPIAIHRVDPPTTIPISIPAIDSSFGRGTDSIVIGGHGGSGPGLVRGIIDGEERNGGTEWVGADLQTRILASGKPRYPESLRQAAIDGRVLVRFVVDTSGRIDMSSVSVVASTHDLFTRAVRDALPSFRFKPAEQAGRRVRALAEMPFEFQITK